MPSVSFLRWRYRLAPHESGFKGAEAWGLTPDPFLLCPFAFRLSPLVVTREPTGHRSIVLAMTIDAKAHLELVIG
jgi:hypothetical protein